ELLRIHRLSAALRMPAGVLLLRAHVGTADADRLELVCTDAPPDDLHRALLAVEPPALSVPDERDRERPIVRSDHQLERIGTGGIEPGHLLGGGYEPPAAVAIGIRVAGPHESGAVLAEDGEERALVVRAAGVEQRGDRGVRIGESLLRCRPRRRRERSARAARSHECYR